MGELENHGGENQQEIVSERTDEMAEEQFIKESAVYDLRDKMVEDFDAGFSLLSYDESFKEAYKNALDTLIQNSVSQLVNVNDLSALAPEKNAAIKAAVIQKMVMFQEKLKQEVGYGRDISDVEDTKRQFTDIFSYKEFLPQADYGEIEGKGNADMSMTLEGDLKNPKSLDISYQEPGKERIKMSIKSNPAYFADPEKTTPGSLADKVGKNRDIYLVAAVNYRIEKPEEFQSFIQEELKAQGLDLKTLTEQQGLTAAVELVKKNLTVATAEQESQMMAEKHPSNTTPIDQLIMQGGLGVCRHYAAASRVVFEQIQDLAGEAENDNLADTVVFENYMENLSHGTLGIARGNNVTTMDPFWYAEGSSKKMDSTFDGKHGNVSSLYQTLSRVPLDRPEDKIFDLGNITQVTSTLMKTQGETGLQKLDNRYQGVLSMAKGIALNEDLHTTQNLLASANNLSIIARELRGSSSVVDKIYVEGIKSLAKEMLNFVEQKIENNADGHLPLEESDNLLLSRALLKLAYRSAAGESIISEEDETADMTSRETKQEFNLEIAYHGYNEARNKFKMAVGESESKFNQSEGLEPPKWLAEEYIQPAINAAQQLTAFILGKGLEHEARIVTPLGKFVGMIEAKLPSLCDMSQKIAGQVLPIFKKVVKT